MGDGDFPASALRRPIRIPPVKSRISAPVALHPGSARFVISKPAVRFSTARTGPPIPTALIFDIPDAPALDRSQPPDYA